MIVPTFWAEARLRHRARGRQITVRRSGWSDLSQDEAQAHAEGRAKLALERALSNDLPNRREPRVPYNGAEGVPIREEIVSRHGNTIVTRNSYGARCLNTPNVLFADIDFARGPSFGFGLRIFLVLISIGILLAWQADWRPSAGLLLLSQVICGALATAMAYGLHPVIEWLRGGQESIARRRAGRFVAREPEWNLRLYRTPAGVRLMATHQHFAPDDAIVKRFFRAVGSDPIYVRMCMNQRCFRARVSPKFWRIGMARIPTRGVWPLDPERMEVRNAWISEYESRTARFAACSFVEEIGSGAVDAGIGRVIQLHDEMCRANEMGLAIA